MEPMRRYILTRVEAKDRMECRAYMRKTYKIYLLYAFIYCVSMLVIGAICDWDLHDLIWDLVLVMFMIVGMLYSHWILWSPPKKNEMDEIGDELI